MKDCCCVGLDGIGGRKPNYQKLVDEWKPRYHFILSEKEAFGVYPDKLTSKTPKRKNIIICVPCPDSLAGPCPPCPERFENVTSTPTNMCIRTPNKESNQSKCCSSPPCLPTPIQLPQDCEKTGIAQRQPSLPTPIRLPQEKTPCEKTNQPSFNSNQPIPQFPVRYQQDCENIIMTNKCQPCPAKYKVELEKISKQPCRVEACPANPCAPCTEPPDPAKIAQTYGAIRYSTPPKQYNYLYRCESRELLGGKLLTYCLCLKRNGLQQECPRTPCRGRPPCLEKPWPDCWPSGGCHGIDFTRKRGFERVNPTLQYRLDKKQCGPYQDDISFCV